MGYYGNLPVDCVTITGDIKSGVSHLTKDISQNTLLATGATVPSAVSGYAKGCIFIKTGATTGTKGFYENQGTTTSCVFVLTGRKNITTMDKTVATTGTTTWYVTVPEAGVLSAVDFSCVDALTAHNDNHVTFAITNLAQDGTGSNVMLLAGAAANHTDANAATPGTSIAANTRRTLTLNTDATKLVVAEGDRLKIEGITAGTLANTLTFAGFSVKF